MKCLVVIVLLCFAVVSKAQNSILVELQKNVPMQGTVTVHQDPAITALIGTVPKYEEGKRELKARGYRVQVYARNNSRDARSQANSMAKQVEAEFPELPVYAYFRPPRWLCCVGDFKTIEEADAVMRRLKATGHYKEVSIVREQINISWE